MARHSPFELCELRHDLIAVHKNYQVLSVPGRDGKLGVSLQELLTSRYGPVLVVHRIDKDTSGLIVFARTPEAHAHLSKQFEARQVEKRYRAIVSGAPPESHGTIDLALAVNKRAIAVLDRTGKSAQTEYRTLESFRGFSHLELKPSTGRYHQIRAHLKALGCPLCVDPVYGNKRSLSIADIKKRANFGNREESGSLIARTPLHASYLKLQAPDGGILEYESPIPKDMRACIKQLRKWRNLE